MKSFSIKFNFLQKNLFLKKPFSFFSSSIQTPTYNPLPLINLSTFRDNPGARPSKTIKGRGPGCKKGKTSGRGHKGKQHGYRPPVHIQGGQTPFARLVPKISYIKKGPIYAEVNLGKIAEWVLKGRLNPEKPITIRQLALCGAFSKPKRGIKLLAKGGELLEKCPGLSIIVNYASKDAIRLVTENKGTVTCEYKSKLGLKYTTKPYKFYREIRDPVLKYRKVLMYMKLESMGAKVVFNKPKWYVNEYGKLKERIEKIWNKVKTMKNSEILPSLPVDRSKGSGDSRVRKGNVIRTRKINLDNKKSK